MTSSNTGVPDISGSVYSKTQVGAVLVVCCFAGKQDGERGLHREEGSVLGATGQGEGKRGPC